MAELILLAVCAMIARLALFWAMPWMAKTASLYALHTLRDRAYAAARRVPAIRNTLLYRDVEFLLCGLIYMCRDGSPVAVDALVTALRRPPPEFEIHDNWRLDVYKKELRGPYADASGHASLVELFDISQRAKPYVNLRWAADRPLVLASCVFVGVFLMVKATLDKLFAARPDPAETLTRDVETVANAFHPDEATPLAA